MKVSVKSSSFGSFFGKTVDIEEFVAYAAESGYTDVEVTERGDVVMVKAQSPKNPRFAVYIEGQRAN